MIPLSYIVIPLSESYFVSFMGETTVVLSPAAVALKELGRQLTARGGGKGDKCETMWLAQWPSASRWPYPVATRPRCSPRSDKR